MSLGSAYNYVEYIVECITLGRIAFECRRAVYPKSSDTFQVTAYYFERDGKMFR